MNKPAAVCPLASAKDAMRLLLAATLWVAISVSAAPALAQTPAAAPAAGIVTVPMQLELNRPYIDVTLVGPNGKRVAAHAWVDTGGGALVLSAGLAKRLGLKPTAKARHAEGHVYAPTSVPNVRLGGQPVTLTHPRAIIAMDAPHTLNYTDAQLALPGRFLRHYVVVFNYPDQTFTIAKPGAFFSPTGTAIKAYIGKSGMPVVWLHISGKSWGFLMDTGGQTNMVSTARLAQWMEQHPRWHHITGAYGPANMLLGKRAGNKLHMVRIGHAQWGPFRLTGVNVVSRPVGSYEKWMSNIVGKPIIGSIGGSVLRPFRVTIDYPAAKVYLQRAVVHRGAHLRMVGLMLEPNGDGGYVIVRTSGNLEGVQAGDRLLQVDGHKVTGVAYATVAGWLSGSPGQTRTLTLQRDGRRLTVSAPVTTIL